MSGESGFWERVTEEVRTVSDRTRREARRAVQTGLLHVDLVSLRRDRTRALADLGERALALWGRGVDAIEADPEAARVRDRIARIDERIEAKRLELERLHEEGRSYPPRPDSNAPANEPGSPAV